MPSGGPTPETVNPIGVMPLFTIADEIFSDVGVSYASTIRSCPLPDVRFPPAIVSLAPATLGVTRIPPDWITLLLPTESERLICADTELALKRMELVTESAAGELVPVT